MDCCVHVWRRYLHIVSRSRTEFPKEAFVALSPVLTRMHVAVDKKRSIHPSIHPRILTLAASFSRSLPCCLFFLLLWAEDAVLVWTSMMCYTTTRFQHGGAHHMHPDSKSITFPTSDAPTGSQLDANKQTKNKCQSLYLKTNAANVIWWASKHRLLLGGCWRLCGPVYETHLIFFPFLHNMFFFFSSLSHCTPELPQSSLYIPVVVMATGQHLSLSFVRCLPSIWASPGFRFCMQIENPTLIEFGGSGCDRQADRLSMGPFPTKSPRRQQGTKEHRGLRADTQRTRISCN